MTTVQGCVSYIRILVQYSSREMALTDIPTIDELAEITGQSKEQLRKDREAASKMVRQTEDE